jgi:hypothetical protein
MLNLSIFIIIFIFRSRLSNTCVLNNFKKLCDGYELSTWRHSLKTDIDHFNKKALIPLDNMQFVKEKKL